MRVLSLGVAVALLSACQMGMPSGKSGRGVSTVERGVTLPFGTVGVQCEVRKKDMGKQVDQFPRSGKSTWQLFDTNPTSTGPRTQYITGFKDGCARQVTASMILFGSPALHETHRYSKSRARVSWSQADNAYEEIKSKVCKVAAKKPCPVEKLGKLENNMAFVSAYKRFGGTDDRLELLLYNGKVRTEELR